MPKKGRLRQFPDLRGAWQEGGDVFEGGSDTQMHTIMHILQPKGVIVIPDFDKFEVTCWGWGDFNPLPLILLLILSRFR